MTTLKKFYCINILNDKFRFCTSDSYKFPKETDLDSFENYINSLPFDDTPEVFGLH